MDTIRVDSYEHELELSRTRIYSSSCDSLGMIDLDSLGMIDLEGTAVVELKFVLFPSFFLRSTVQTQTSIMELAPGDPGQLSGLSRGS